MFVRELRIRRVRQLEDVEIGPLPAPGKNSDVIVLAGPNGGGKSTVLELLSVGLSSTWGFSYNTRRQFGDASFEIGFGVSAADLERAREYAIDKPDYQEAIAALAERRVCYRAFGYSGGEYDRSPQLNDSIYRLLSNALSDRFGAIFLRSDRFYDRQQYRRERIFDSQSRRGRAYMRSMAFNLTSQQYTDMMEFFIEEAYNYPRALGLHQLQRDGSPAPENPLQPYDALFRRLFPQYRLSTPKAQLADQLFITLPSGADIPFADLSSGEQEVFFLLSFFLRNDISGSMVFVDEPEMHLHPDLARQMTQLMRSVRPGNQIWLATHNADLIEEAGRDKTYFITRGTPTSPATVVRATDAPDLVSLLRTMFGQSGFVGLARRLVFLEGDSSSPDRRVFTSLFPEYAQAVQFIPLNSSDNMLRINRAVLAVLGEALGFSEFFLIRDRDYLPDEVVARYESDFQRLFILKRHEIENYLLDAETIADAVNSLLGGSLTAEEINDKMRDVAERQAGEVLKGLAAAHLNSLFQSYDCSIGGFGRDQVWWQDGDWNQQIVEAARERFSQVVLSARTSLNAGTDAASVDQILSDCANKVGSALAGMEWKRLFPGKELLQETGRRLGIGSGTILVNAAIRNLAEHPERIDPELSQIVRSIAAPVQAATATATNGA